MDREKRGEQFAKLSPAYLLFHFRFCRDQLFDRHRLLCGCGKRDHDFKQSVQNAKTPRSKTRKEWNAWVGMYNSFSLYRIETGESLLRVSSKQEAEKQQQQQQQKHSIDPYRVFRYPHF